MTDDYEASFPGLRFDRHTEIRRGDKVLATARTVWVPIDPATGRPKRVPERVRTMFSQEDNHGSLG